MIDPSGRSAGSATVGDAAARRTADRVWRSLERHRGSFDVIEIGDVGLCLLYLRGRPAWELLAGGLDVELAVRRDMLADDAGAATLRPILESVRKISDARLMAPLVDVVNQLTDDVPFSRVYSALLERMATATGRKGGEFYTPESITVLAAELLDPAPSDRILDPCCKAGGFPAAVADLLIQDGEAVDQLKVAVSDYSAHSFALAYLNLRSRGVVPTVLPGAAESLPAGGADSRYDKVMANPPFNLSHWSGDRHAGRWLFGVPPAHNANFAWLQYAVASLDRDGQAVVVMPNGAASSQNAHERSIRAAMVEHGAVSAVIAMPGQMFASTQIPVMLWLLQRPPDRRPDEVLFVDATGLGGVQDRARRVLDRAEIDRIIEIRQSWREGGRPAMAGLAAGVPIQKVRESDYQLNPRTYVQPIDQVPDLHARVRHVEELSHRLHTLAEDAARVDRTIEAHLRELSL